MTAPKALSLHLPNRQDFLKLLTRTSPRGVLFVETTRRTELAEQIVVLVDFPTERRSFRLRGKIISRRSCSLPPGLATLPAGVEVELGTGEERTVQLIMDHVAGKSIEFIDRKSRRIICEIERSYRTDADFINEFIEDISEGGTFIRTNRLLPVGSPIECKLKPPGYLLGVKLRSRVAWVKSTGRPHGMGLQFLFENERKRNKLRRIINKLSVEQSRQLIQITDEKKKVNYVPTFRGNHR